MAEQDQSRTEQATPHKLEEARKHGQVAKSLDVNSVTMLAAVTAVLMATGTALWKRLMDLESALFASAAVAGESVQPLAIGAEMLGATVQLLAPLLGMALIAAIAANLFQTGPMLSWAALKPKWERLNPINGFKRVFNKRLLFEAVKSVIKLCILGWITFAFLRSRAGTVPGFWASDGMSQAQWMVGNAFNLMLRLLAALLLIGLLDLFYVRMQFRKQMMMSRRELKEETKRREGDPQVRARIRELQRENLKQAASLSRVGEADVLITNPSHVAIALRYVRHQMLAPEVVAKGRDDWALKMKQVARERGIPMYERRSLARTLLKRSAIGAPIPQECFLDVARIYADVDASRRRLVHYETRP